MGKVTKYSLIVLYGKSDKVQSHCFVWAKCQSTFFLFGIGKVTKYSLIVLRIGQFEFIGYL